MSIAIRWFFALLAALAYEGFYSVIAPVTLHISYGLLKLFTHASILGNHVYVGTYTLEFVPACAAVAAYVLLAILILFTRGISFQRGMIMFFYGSALILLANILRIELLIYVLLNFGKNYFDTLHFTLWHVVSSAYVAGVWIFLVWRFKLKEIPVYSDMKYVWNTHKR